MAKKDDFITEYLLTGSVSSASKKAKVSTSTGYRWLQSDEVKKPINAMRQQKLKDVSVKLSNLDSNALQVLTDLMNDDEVNPQTRIQSAMFLLKQSIEMARAEDLESRIKRLEDLSNEINQ